MQQSFNRLLHLRFYIIACLVISVFVVLFKPIYSRNFSKLPTTFAPVHITIATTDLCESYVAIAQTNMRDLFKRGDSEKYNPEDRAVRFYTHNITPSNHIIKPQTRTCVLARNTITNPIAYLAIQADKKALKNIEFISITMGSENFYLSSKQIQEHIQTTKLHKLDSAVTLDLSSYKINSSYTYLNQYGSLMGGLLYYFLSSPYILIWLLFALICIYLYANQFHTIDNIKDSISSSSILESHRVKSKPFTRKQISLMLSLIFILALLLRFYNYNVFSLWGDELYSVGLVGYPDGDFSSVFLDPGNPPFYNFLLKIWLHLFGYTSSAARSLSVLLGSIGVFGMYVLLRSHFFIGPTLKRHTNHSVETHIQNQREAQVIALLGALFFACSFVGIGAAHEVRGYVLELTLVPFVLYFLFNCLKNLHFFNAFLYVLTASLLCNTHYYGAIMIFASFIVSIFLLYGTPKWRKKIVIMFMLNILIACSLMPYFIITAYNQALTDTSFNTWIPTPSFNLLLLYLVQSFGGFVMAVCVFFILLILRLRNTFLLSILAIIALVVLIAFGASFIRPIFFPKYAIYATYALMLCICSGGIIILARAITRTYAERLSIIAIGMATLGIVLFDASVQPVGTFGASWNNYKAHFQFITQDSANKQNAYIVDLTTWMAEKPRQYKLYNLEPNATFVRLDAKKLLDVLKTIDLQQTQSLTFGSNIPSINLTNATLYFDGYFVELDTLKQIFQACKNLGVIVQEIPFGIAFDINMNESQNVVYKVIFP